MEWLALGIPVIFAIILLLFFKHKTQWWEPLPSLVIGLILIASFKGCSEHSLTRDTEYHNGYITEVWYYEDWSEWITRTCSREYACGEDCTTDSEGRTSCSTRYCTEYYDCSYEDYNPEYWMVKNNLGETWRISKAEYQKLVKLFGNQSYVNMNRPYCCGNDGDAYVTYYQGEPEKLQHTATVHTYENRVQASNSVFKFQEISDEDADSLGLFDYPKIIGNYSQDHLLGIKDHKIEQKLDYLNAKLGKKKEVKAFVTVFKNKPANYGELQESYWKGGNKNELNIVLGLSNDGTLAWSKIMTWSESQELKIEIRNHLQSRKGEKLNFDGFIDFLYKEIDEKFIRKEFSDFSYLEVEMTDGQIKALYWTVFIISLIISIFMIVNEFENEHHKNKNINIDWKHYKDSIRFWWNNLLNKFNQKTNNRFKYKK